MKGGWFEEEEEELANGELIDERVWPDNVKKFVTGGTEGGIV